MKDYSTNRMDEKVFILNYEIVDDKIIVNLPKGKKYELQNTEENEKMLLDTMQWQVKCAKQKKGLYNIRFVCTLGMAVMFGFLTVHHAGDLIGGFGNYSTFVNSVLLSMYGTIAVLGTVEAIKTKSKLNDLNKNIMFLNNKRLFKEKVKTDDDILSRDNVLEEEQTVTLNDIHYMSKGEVEDMIDIAIFREKTGMMVSPYQDKAKRLIRKKPYI